MKIRVDANTLGRTFAEGLYKAAFTGRKVSTSQKGNPQMSVELTINSAGPDGSDTVGRKVFDLITFTEDSIWKANLLYSMVTGNDLPEQDYTADELFDLIWNSVMNQQVMVELAVDDYQGQKRMKISKYHPLK